MCNNRFKEIQGAIKSRANIKGRVIYCESNANYLLVDLGENIRGWVPYKYISHNRKYSIAHTLKDKEIYFKVEAYSDERNGFILNRLGYIDEIKQFQKSTFKKGSIITVPITSIFDNGITVDIGNEIEAFIPPSKLSDVYIKNFNDLFYVGQKIQVMIEGYNETFESWDLNYVNCPQFGLSIDNTYIVNVDRKKSQNSYFCTFKVETPPLLKGILVSKLPCTEEGSIEKASIIGFRRGVPLLKTI